jgi:hypothetical protein
MVGVERETCVNSDIHSLGGGFGDRVVASNVPALDVEERIAGFEVVRLADVLPFVRVLAPDFQDWECD